MDKVTNSLLDIFKEYGLNSVLIVLLIFFMTNFNSQLEQIKKDLVSIKISLTEIQSKYIDKETVRDMIDSAIEKHQTKHIQSYHKNQNSN